MQYIFLNPITNQDFLLTCNFMSIFLSYLVKIRNLVLVAKDLNREIGGIYHLI